MLLTNPRDFGKPGRETLPMVQGRYFHVSMIEEHKKDDFEIVDASTRNTKFYKEQAQGKLLLLRKEADQLDRAINEMKNNEEFASEIYAEGTQYEVPMIGEFFGVEFKGKADIITKDKIIDIKTSSSIAKFRTSARIYNYDSQAYIYSSMFNLPFEFFVIDKESLQMKRFTCSDEFLERGRDKVLKAVQVYKRFFTEASTEDVMNYVANEIL
jgi:hypothetical protein